MQRSGLRGQGWEQVGRSLRTCSHSWGLHNYLQMSGPQSHFCLNYMIDCPKGPEFPLNNCIMFLLCYSGGDLVIRVKQMLLISSGSPKAFQGVIFFFFFLCGYVQTSHVCIAGEQLYLSNSKEKTVWLQMKSTLNFLHWEQRRHWCLVWKRG